MPQALVVERRRESFDHLRLHEVPDVGLGEHAPLDVSGPDAGD